MKRQEKSSSENLKTQNVLRFFRPEFPLHGNSGFTLIELLIVIAIIGILSSVVLASLNSARNKAANSVVKASIANLRTQAEMYYDTNFQSYAGVCTSTQFAAMLEKATTTGGGPTTTVSTYCVSEPNAWSAYSNLKIPEGNGELYWCSDNRGISALTTITPPYSTTSCQ